MTPPEASPLADERAFLHELATPLATLTLLTETLCENWQSPGPAPTSREADLKKILQIKKIVDRMGDLLKVRRDALSSHRAT